MSLIRTGDPGALALPNFSLDGGSTTTEQVGGRMLLLHRTQRVRRV